MTTPHQTTKKQQRPNQPEHLNQPGYLTQPQYNTLKKQINHKIQNNPQPTPQQIQQTIQQIQQSKRAGGDLRGSSYARRRRTQKLLQEFGDGTKVGCAHCGKWLTAQTCESDKIITGNNGGRYIYPNIIPSCRQCNLNRSNKPLQALQALQPLQPTYYHGTKHKLPNGTILKPNSPTRKDKYVHFTTDLNTATLFAEPTEHDHGHIYEIEPIGPIEPWRFNQHSYKAPLAKIIREINLYDITTTSHTTEIDDGTTNRNTNPASRYSPANPAPTQLHKTAAPFHPNQILTWETTRPWNTPKQTLEQQIVPGIKTGNPRSSEAASYENGHIVVKDEWFTYPEQTRQAILYHEAGHGLEQTAGFKAIAKAFNVENPLDIIDLQGAKRFSPINYSEIIATAYEVIWCEPEWAEAFEGGTAILSAVAHLATEHGYPLPRNWKTSTATNQIYRGYQINLPPPLLETIKELAAPPLTPKDINNSKQAGPLIIEWLQKNHWDKTLGLGRHWTTNKYMAEIAAMQGGGPAGYGGHSIILTATYNPSDIDTGNTNTTKLMALSESEITLLPGAQVTITDVEIAGFDCDLMSQPIRAEASMGQSETTAGIDQLKKEDSP